MRLDCLDLIGAAPSRFGPSGSRPATDRPAPRRSPRAATGSAKPRILVVEEDWFIATQIETCLFGAGYEVVASVTDAQTAIDKALRERPDLVLMDIRLPGEKDGIAAAQEIFRRLGLRSLFVSAHVDDDTVARARDAEPLGWLQKPFTERELLEVVATVSPPHGRA